VGGARLPPSLGFIRSLQNCVEVTPSNFLALLQNPGPFLLSGIVPSIHTSGMSTTATIRRDVQSFALNASLALNSAMIVLKAKDGTRREIKDLSFHAFNALVAVLQASPTAVWFEDDKGNVRSISSGLDVPG